MTHRVPKTLEEAYERHEEEVEYLACLYSLRYPVIKEDLVQLVIRDFGKETFGGPLFFPNSKEWNAT
ncbi:MAG TPA: hypothetical protein VLW86_03810 [Syntrophorhabdales bacterium]|nr:hypothetical protein [Syntrophorhabdales bacterium]